jgi:hypothetical protein
MFFVTALGALSLQSRIRQFTPVLHASCIIFGGRSTHLVFHVPKRGCKTSIIIIIIIIIHNFKAFRMMLRQYP